MKIKALFLSISSILMLNTFAFSNAKQTVNTSVYAATVYTQGAQLTRIKKLNLKTGENTVKFTNLELDINTNSIQVYGLNSNENFTVVSTQFHEEESNDAQNTYLLRKLEDSLVDIHREVSLINSKINNFKLEKNLILSHTKINTEESNDFILRLSNLAKYYRESTNEIDRLVYDLNFRKNELTISENRINRRITQETKKQRFGVIEAKIYAKTAIERRVKLTYMVTDVNWTPFYTIKSDGLKSPLKVSCKATINQNTGVDWKKVKLTLSTRKPEALHAVPKVHPWILHFKTKLTQYSQQNQLINTHAISNASLPVQISNQSVNNQAPATINTAQYLSRFTHATHKMINKEYKNNIQYNISGDDGVAVVDLDLFEMKSKYVYYAVPKYDQNVYLVAEVANWEQYDLIPAFANIFLENNYIGKLFIDPSTIDESLTLMLGKDQNIQINRKKTNHKDDKQRRLVESTETTEIGIEINIKNKKSIPIDVVVKDQIPVSKHEEITVNMVDSSDAKINKSNGILTWTYTLDPYKSKRHYFQYKVKRPKGKKIANF